MYPNAGSSLIYSLNGLWNADGTLYAHNTDEHGTVDIIDVETGATVAASVPFNPSGDSLFDPVDPDIFYYFSGTKLMEYSVSKFQSFEVKDFGRELRTLGGSADYIDRTGRYFLLNLDGELKIWDKHLDALYAGSIPYSLFKDTNGWAGISPDGKFVIMNTDWNHLSYEVNHAERKLSEAGVLFWALCGDHGDIISASDGKTYQITQNCYDAPDIYKVDVSIPKFPIGTFFDGPPKFTQEEISAQTSGSTKLLTISWTDEVHYSCAETTDICYASIESQTDPSQSRIVKIHMNSPYMIETLTPINSLGKSYMATARVNSSLDGSKAIFASDQGRKNAEDNYSDIYVIENKNP